jgi:hypothetical protein
MNEKQDPLLQAAFSQFVNRTKVTKSPVSKRTVRSIHFTGTCAQPKDEIPREHILLNLMKKVQDLYKFDEQEAEKILREITKLVNGTHHYSNYLEDNDGESDFETITSLVSLCFTSIEIDYLPSRLEAQIALYLKIPKTDCQFVFKEATTIYEGYLK